MVARELPDQIDVERLGEARIGNGGRQPRSGKLVGGLEASCKRPPSDSSATADPSRRTRPLPIGSSTPSRGNATPVPSPRGYRTADGPSSIAAAVATMCRSSASSAAAMMVKPGRQPRYVTSNEPACVGPSRADDAGAIDGEANGKLLDGDVVHDLVVGALQEGRIDRRERLHALGGETGGKRHRMLLGDADVEGPFGKFAGEEVDTGAVGHGGGNADDPIVLPRLGDQALAEHRV